VKINDSLMLKPKDPKHGTGYINKKDISISENYLFKTNPKLQELINYLQEMSDLLTNLALPIIWITPSGVRVTQKYVEFKSKKVKHSLYKGANPRTIVIHTDKISRGKRMGQWVT
jgi:hypothetical protein